MVRLREDEMAYEILSQPVKISPSSLSHPNGHLYMVKSPLAVNSFYSGKSLAQKEEEHLLTGWNGFKGRVSG
ncbi:hypothetical protein DY000_02023206 [Brassica cretica]|uniref:Uncharacterized protein n=1 Tax=Brassica cretica TaxID=69181 RepID=A0ABQ7E9F1_BRACR|nr:hypothetical protein DY000_02023206 [Brassica cretica]